MFKQLATSVFALGVCTATLANTGADLAVPLKDPETILDRKSYIDSYDPALGAYGVDNVFPAPSFSYGNTLPDMTAPTGMASNSGVIVHDKVNVTLSADTVCDNFSLINWANLTIEGDVTLVVNNSFTVENQSSIILAEGARLTVYCLNEARINDHCHVNSDTSRPGAVRIVKLGDSAMLVANQSSLSGMVYAPSTHLEVVNGSDFYGGLFAQSLYLANTGAAHFTVAAPYPTTASPLYD